MKKKGRLYSILLVVLLIIGVSLMLYPTLSEAWNSKHQTRAIETYQKVVSHVEPENYDHLLKEARAFNRELLLRYDSFSISPDQKMVYEKLLTVESSGIMGYVEIPDIDCRLPFYHGVEDSVLQRAVGHMEWSSLPVGGKSTHCVLSAHRGLPSAKLFTDLDELVEGDVFFLNVLNETLAYEVDQIRIVEPEQVDDLRIQEGKDYCTLVTCTPYGVNSHRMLVRGHRVENPDNYVNVSADAIEVETFIVAPAIAVPILLILFIVFMFMTRKKKKGGK